ncbi:MAG: CSLREA domain-containing protein [Roseiflexaceae bacterium]
MVTKLADTNDGVCDSDCSLREAIATVSSEDTFIPCHLPNRVSQARTRWIMLVVKCRRRSHTTST